MPIRLILVLLLVIFEGAFIGFNLENICNVWLFKVHEAVPVYVTVLIAFVAGVLLSMIFFAFGRKRSRAAAKGASDSAMDASPREGKKKRAGGSRKEKDRGAEAVPVLQKDAPSFDYPDRAEIAGGHGASSSPPDNSGGGHQGGV